MSGQAQQGWRWWSTAEEISQHPQISDHIKMRDCLMTMMIQWFDVTATHHVATILCPMDSLHHGGGRQAGWRWAQGRSVDTQAVPQKRPSPSSPLWRWKLCLRMRMCLLVFMMFKERRLHSFRRNTKATQTWFICKHWLSKQPKKGTYLYK